MITGHAIEQYQRRIENLPVETVVKILTSPLLRTAVEAGALTVKIRGGGTALIRDGAIVTVLAPGQKTGNQLAALSKRKHRRRRAETRHPRHQGEYRHDEDGY